MMSWPGCVASTAIFGRHARYTLGPTRMETMMAVHPIEQARASDTVRLARIQLAAAHRLAVFHELDEGIDNHFTMTLPGPNDRYLILPFGLHWSEARASDLR